MRIASSLLAVVPVVTLVGIAALGACSEGNTKDPNAPTDTGSPIVDSGTTHDTSTTTDATLGPLVVNEVRSADGDYIELFNGGSAPFDLSGFTMSGTKLDESGAPNTFTFPSGAMVPADGYLLIVAKDADAGPGPTNDCLEAGVTSCFHVSWSVSNKVGAALIITSPMGVVAASANIPANAAPTGETYGRLPNGTGDFTGNAPTPGAANRAP